MKTVKVGITTEKASAKEFVEAWKRAERKERHQEPAERLYFLDAGALLKVLSTQRLALLTELRRDGTLKISELARRLNRNYKNVHDDVSLLKQAGLIEQDERGAYVPYDIIRAEIDLAA